MKLTILGCTGSLSAPGNPGSSYLITTPNNPGIVMDCGPGALAALQEYHDPADVHLIFSHLHADHFSDSASLVIWRRFHPTTPATRRHQLHGPSYTAAHIGRLGADGPDQIDDISDTFDFSPWVSNQPVDIDAVRVTPVPVVHPAQESHALRVQDTQTGKVLTYSGDSGMTDSLIDAARDADLFLCEAAWGPSAQGKTEGLHLSGAQAGEIARRAGVHKLVLVHIQPWADKEATVAAAREEFDGEVILGQPGQVFEL